MPEYTIEQFTDLIENVVSVSWTNYKGVDTLEEITEEWKENNGDGDTLTAIINFVGEGGVITFITSNGEKIEAMEDENSVYHDGAEIGMIFGIDNQFFRIGGSYSSHDSDYYDSSFVKVSREVRLEPKVYYTAI